MSLLNLIAPPVSLSMTLQSMIHRPEPVILDYTSNAPASQHVSVSAGQPLQLKLRSNPSTGYQWTVVANADGSCGPKEAFEEVDYRHTTDKHPAGYVGVPGKDLITVKATDAAVKGSQCEISLVHGRPWEKNNIVNHKIIVHI